MARLATSSHSYSPPLDGVSALLEHISELRLHEIEGLQQQRARGSAQAAGSDRDLALLLFAEEAEGLLNVSKDHMRERRYRDDLLDRLIEMEETARYDRAFALALAEGRPPPPRPPRLRKRARDAADGGEPPAPHYSQYHATAGGTAQAWDIYEEEERYDAYAPDARPNMRYTDEDDSARDEGDNGSSWRDLSDLEGRPVRDDIQAEFVEYEFDYGPSLIPSPEHEGSDVDSYVDEAPLGPSYAVGMEGASSIAGPTVNSTGEAQYEGEERYEEQYDGGYEYEGQVQSEEAPQEFWQDDDGSQGADESEREDVSGGEVSEGGDEYEAEFFGGEDEVHPDAYSDGPGDYEFEAEPPYSYASDGSQSDGTPPRDWEDEGPPSDAAEEDIADYHEPPLECPIALPRPYESCVICGDDVLGMVVRLRCGHGLDMACLQAMFERATADESLFPPQCCKRAVELPDVERFLSRSLIDHFQEKAREFRTANRVYCYNPYCSAFLGAATLSPTALRCSACASTTCASCKEQAHPRAGCRSAGDDALLSLAKEKEWQRCARCQYLVERSGGCPHMQCRCGAQFCYLCGKEWGKCTGSCPRR